MKKTTTTTLRRGEHTIDQTFEVASDVWAETFKYLADNNVMFDRMLLKPSMVGPGADCPVRNTPEAGSWPSMHPFNPQPQPSAPQLVFFSPHTHANV